MCKKKSDPVETEIKRQAEKPLTDEEAQKRLDEFYRQFEEVFGGSDEEKAGA